MSTFLVLVDDGRVHLATGKTTTCGLVVPDNAWLTRRKAWLTCQTCRAAAGDIRETRGVDDLGDGNDLVHQALAYVEVHVTDAGTLVMDETGAYAPCGITKAGRDPRQNDVVTCLACLAWPSVGWRL